MCRSTQGADEPGWPDLSHLFVAQTTHHGYIHPGHLHNRQPNYKPKSRVFTQVPYIFGNAYIPGGPGPWPALSCYIDICNFTSVALRSAEREHISEAGSLASTVQAIPKFLSATRWHVWSGIGLRARSDMLYPSANSFVVHSPNQASYSKYSVVYLYVRACRGPGWTRRI